MRESKESAAWKNADQTGARIRYSLIDAVRGVAVVSMLVCMLLFRTGR